MAATVAPTAAATPSLVILFVADPLASAVFYRDLLGAEPVEQSPTFAMFTFPSGVALGLWSRATTAPTVTASPGATEVCFVEADVDATFRLWSARGARIAQLPTEMDFGRTFVALDPDGHRLRVFHPAEAGTAHA